MPFFFVRADSNICDYVSSNTYLNDDYCSATSHSIKLLFCSHFGFFPGKFGIGILIPHTQKKKVLNLMFLGS